MQPGAELRLWAPEFVTMSEAEWHAVMSLLAEMLVPVIRRQQQARKAA